MDELNSLPRDCGVKIAIDKDVQKVYLIFEDLAEDPDGPTGVEVALSPELSRDLAFTLTRASYIVEGDDSL